MINELTAEGKVQVTGLITKCDPGRTNKGTPYLSLTLEDKSGVLDCKFWNLTEEQTSAWKAGMVVHATGDIIIHRNAIQLRIRKLEEVKDAVITDYTREAPATCTQMKEEVQSLIASLDSPMYKEILSDLIGRRETEFFTYPAATRNHHNFVGGLAWHTLSMARDAQALLPLYPFLDRDLLMAGILLHDYGKTMELSGPLLTEYTNEGNLLGHISMAAAEVEGAAARLGYERDEDLVLLEHMILSHHGRLEYGSPVVPMIPEAEVLNLLDNLDARMYMMEQSLDTLTPGHFGPRVFPLDNRMLYKRKEKENKE